MVSQVWKKKNFSSEIIQAYVQTFDKWLLYHKTWIQTDTLHNWPIFLTSTLLNEPCLELENLKTDIIEFKGLPYEYNVS